MSADATTATREELIAAGIISSPRQPTVADRRLIMEELEAHYDIKECCYAGAESDATLAQRLDMPRAWVADIRAQFFGDLAVNGEEKKVMEDIAKALKEFNSLKGRLGQMEGVLAELEVRSVKIMNRAGRR